MKKFNQPIPNQGLRAQGSHQKPGSVPALPIGDGTDESQLRMLMNPECFDIYPLLGSGKVSHFVGHTLSDAGRATGYH